MQQEPILVADVSSVWIIAIKQASKLKGLDWGSQQAKRWIASSEKYSQAEIHLTGSLKSATPIACPMAVVDVVDVVDAFNTFDTQPARSLRN
jgi:hypothetical protein